MGGRKRTKKTLDDGFTELEQEHRRKQEAAGVTEPTGFLDQIAFLCTRKPTSPSSASGSPRRCTFSTAFTSTNTLARPSTKVRGEEARSLKAEDKDSVLSKIRFWD